MHHTLDPLAASVTAVVALAVSVPVSAADAAVAAVLLLSKRISGASPVIFFTLNMCIYEESYNIGDNKSGKGDKRG